MSWFERRFVSSRMDVRLIPEETNDGTSIDDDAVDVVVGAVWRRLDGVSSLDSRCRFERSELIIFFRTHLRESWHQ